LERLIGYVGDTTAEILLYLTFGMNTNCYEYSIDRVIRVGGYGRLYDHNSTDSSNN